MIAEETIRFSLKLQSKSVVLERQDGSEWEVTVNELPGPESEDYQDSIKDRLDVEMDDKGKLKVKSIRTFKGSYESLLKLCLRNKATGELVPVEQIQAFPASVQKGLFEIAQRLNGLGEDSQAKLKNA